MSPTPKDKPVTPSQRQARLFARILGFSARLAHRPLMGRLVYPLMRFFAWATLRKHKARRQQQLEALAHEWQRMFPNRDKDHPIVSIDARQGVALARIETHCPLRATGDIRACHRLMAYDRAMVARMGGHFEVLSSQSNSGQPYCEVALRLGPPPKPASA